VHFALEEVKVGGTRESRRELRWRVGSTSFLGWRGFRGGQKGTGHSAAERRVKRLDSSGGGKDLGYRANSMGRSVHQSAGNTRVTEVRGVDQKGETLSEVSERSEERGNLSLYPGKVERARPVADTGGLGVCPTPFCVRLGPFGTSGSSTSAQKGGNAREERHQRKKRMDVGDSGVPRFSAWNGIWETPSLLPLSGKGHWEEGQDRGGK